MLVKNNELLLLSVRKVGIANTTHLLARQSMKP